MKIRLEIKEAQYKLILNSSTSITFGLLSFGFDVAEGFKFGLGKFYELFEDVPSGEDVIIDSGSIEDLGSSVTFFLDVMAESITSFVFDLPTVAGPINVKSRDKSQEIPVYENGYFIKQIFQDSEHTIEVRFECEENEYSFGISDDDGYYVDEDIKVLLESDRPSSVIDAVAEFK